MTSLESSDTVSAAEGHDGILTIRGGGQARAWYGIKYKAGPLENEAGDFIFIAPGVPHEVFNLSAADPVVAIVARSDASEWENIVPFERPRVGG